MLTYTIGIVAHTARAQAAHDLMATVGATYLSMDNGELGGDANHLRVWSELAKQDSQWSVVLEDDSRPISDFANQLRSALDAAPTGIVSLYLGKAFPIDWQSGIGTAIQRAQASNASFITSGRLLHAVGVAIQTELVPHLLSMPHQALPIDEHITRWAQYSRTQPAIAYTYPSLVDHADGEPVIRMHNDGIPRTPGRKAWYTGPRSHWDSTVVEMGPQ